MAPTRSVSALGALTSIPHLLGAELWGSEPCWLVQGSYVSGLLTGVRPQEALVAKGRVGVGESLPLSLCLQPPLGWL